MAWAAWTDLSWLVLIDLGQQGKLLVIDTRLLVEGAITWKNPKHEQSNRVPGFDTPICVTLLTGSCSHGALPESFFIGDLGHALAHFLCFFYKKREGTQTAAVKPLTWQERIQWGYQGPIL